MKNFYTALGLNNSATPEEIRRAYRTLARRYHPDVNPGQESSNKFKLISEAYRTLQDPARRKDYDLKLELHERIIAEQKLRTYAEKFQKRAAAYSNKNPQHSDQFTKDQPKPKNNQSNKVKKIEDLKSLLNVVKEKYLKAWLPGDKNRAPTGSQSAQQVSIIEISLSLEDAIRGIKKTIEVQEGTELRKVSVRIPPGVKTGSVIRMRNRFALKEELVLIVSVAHHPFMHLEKKGLVVELPITIYEAVHGANVTVPTLSDQLVIKVPAGSQSGTYIRLKGRGIPDKNGRPGDLFFLVMVNIPDDINSADLKQLSTHLQELYSNPVRSKLPRQLIEPVRNE